MTATLANTFQTDSSALAARFAIGLVIGLGVTAGLFWIMQYMIETADREIVEDPFRATLEFVRVIRDEDIIRKTPEFDKPPPPQQPPRMPENVDFDEASATIPVGSMNPPDIKVGDNFGLGGPGALGEGDYLPIVRVVPIYPRRALAQGIEGHCDVQFTVTRHGTVRDPEVIPGRCSSSLFARASLEAALKFKFKPRVIDGVAVEVSGVQNRFTYRITE